MFMARREACLLLARREACVPSARREACAFPHPLVELLAMAFPWSGVLLAVIALRQTAVSSGDHRVDGPQWTKNHPYEGEAAFMEVHLEHYEGHASGDHCDGEPQLSMFFR